MTALEFAFQLLVFSGMNPPLGDRSARRQQHSLRSDDDNPSLHLRISDQVSSAAGVVMNKSHNFIDDVVSFAPEG